MIPLTYQDIEQKTFKPALQGSRESDVDGLLDEVADTLRFYELSLEEATKKIKELAGQLDR